MYESIVDTAHKISYSPFMGLANRSLFLMLLIAQPSLGFFENELQVQTFQYTSDNAPTFYFANKSVFESEHFLGQINLYGESGTKGVFSFDPDPLRYTVFLDQDHESLLWFGREHPENLIRKDPVEPFTALGSIWGQNQIQALKPRVSGWIGTGLVLGLGAEFKLSVAYSPIFLPTFGPSLGFTRSGEINPTRFARLPPSDAVTGGVDLPIRYQLELGNLSRLLFQQQGFLGLSKDGEDLSLETYAFTAPAPDPVANTQAKLAVNSSDVNAKVYINPDFPREYWSGFRSQAKKIPFRPAFEIVQNLKQWSAHTLSLTGYFQQGSFGLLTHFQKNYAGPTLSDGLVFFSMPFQLLPRLTLTTLIQTTLLHLRQGFYFFNELEFRVQSRLSLVLGIRVISGQDHSYFGDWRDEDSYSGGVKWTW